VKPLLGLGEVGRLEDGTKVTGHSPSQTVRRLREDVPFQVYGAALTSDFRKKTTYGLDQTTMLIGDHELNPGKAAFNELPQELSPAVLALLHADAHSQQAPMTVRHDSVATRAETFSTVRAQRASRNVASR